MAETARTRALKTLARQLPVANQQIAQQLQQTRQTQLQAQLGQATPGLGVRAAQQVGAQQAAEAGKIQLQTQQQGMQQAQQLGQMAFKEQQAINQQQLANQQLAQREQARLDQDKLSKLGREFKQELFDSKTQFQRDQNGQAVWQESQLADWAMSKAKSAEDFKNYAQSAEQLHKKKISMLETSQAKIKAELEKQYQLSEQKRNQGLVYELEEMTRNMDARIRSEYNRLANNLSTWQAGGTVVGGIVGGVIGSYTGAGAVPGAMAGASVGGAAGTAVGSQQG